MRACFILLTALTALASEPDAERGARLAENGHCEEAMPVLAPYFRAAGASGEKDLRKRAGVNYVRCAMDLGMSAEAAAGIRQLTREFPSDAETLYLAVHIYSELSIRASQELLRRAPGSRQARELSAESLEAQGKWAEAAAEYRAILEKEPHASGIHYRLGRLLLSAPKTESSKDDARREFEAELRINPNNAGAEFVLGELARQREEWPAAIEHFSRAARLDPAFVDAFLGLGRALVAAERPAEALAPLETAAKLQPANPVAHFTLATAYRRTGREGDAEKEMAAYRRAAEDARASSDELHRALAGAVGGR